jgi:hypothetical protein
MVWHNRDCVLGAFVGTKKTKLGHYPILDLTVLINTPLQRGGCTCTGAPNRFSGFQSDRIAAEVRETAEAVHFTSAAHNHPAEAGC